MYMIFIQYVSWQGSSGAIEHYNPMKIKGLSDFLWEYTKKVLLEWLPEVSSCLLKFVEWRGGLLEELGLQVAMLYYLLDSERKFK